MRRPTIRERRPLILVGWIVAVLATQAWPSWESGIRDLFAHDVVSYETIAAAAPGLPAAAVTKALPGAPPERLNVAFAQRFPVHWLVGTVSWATGANLEDVYRAASAICLLALLLVLHRVFVALELDDRAYALSIGLVVASVYPVRYLLAAPGMLTDGVFVLGFAVVVLGFVRRQDMVVVLGVALAAAARQTAVPLAIAAAIGLLLSGRGRRPSRVAWAALTAAVGVGVFEAEAIVARPFSWDRPGHVSGFGSLGLVAHPVRILTGNAGSDARALLGVLLPVAVIAGLWLRGRRPSLLALFLAAVVIGQPFVIFEGNNSTRLAALALPGLALVVAYQLHGLRLPLATALVVSAALFVASLHSRYADVAVPNSTVWAAMVVAAAALVVLVLCTSLDVRLSRAPARVPPRPSESEATAALADRASTP